MSKLLSASLLTLGIAFAMPSAAQQDLQILSTLRDTSTTRDWLVMSLGGTSNENFDWAAKRTYVNGVLNSTAKYSMPGKIADNVAQGNGWVTGTPWIGYSSVADKVPNGYYSYVTIVDGIGNDVGGIPFNALRITFAADDHLQAIVFNGVEYSAFAPQASDHSGWAAYSYVDILLDDIVWNVNGRNFIEFVVHNNNSTSGYGSANNISGLSATIQATYISSVVPEPSTLLMWPLGGVVLAGTAWNRRRRTKNSG
jgi:hypothetical protein